MELNGVVHSYFRIRSHHNLQFKDLILHCGLMFVSEDINMDQI
jgi:hypothetical protein